MNNKLSNGKDNRLKPVFRNRSTQLQNPIKHKLRVLYEKQREMPGDLFVNISLRHFVALGSISNIYCSAVETGHVSEQSI